MATSNKRMKKILFNPSAKYFSDTRFLLCAHPECPRHRSEFYKSPETCGVTRNTPNEGGLSDLAREYTIDKMVSEGRYEGLTRETFGNMPEELRIRMLNDVVTELDAMRAENEVLQVEKPKVREVKLPASMLNQAAATEAPETTDAVANTEDAMEVTTPETTDAVANTEDAMEVTTPETTTAVANTEDAMEVTIPETTTADAAAENALTPAQKREQEKSEADAAELKRRDEARERQLKMFDLERQAALLGKLYPPTRMLMDDPVLVSDGYTYCYTCIKPEDEILVYSPHYLYRRIEELEKSDDIETDADKKSELSALREVIAINKFPESVKYDEKLYLMPKIFPTHTICKILGVPLGRRVFEDLDVEAIAKFNADLERAVHENNASEIKKAIALGANVNYKKGELLSHAVGNEHIQAVAALIESNAKQDYPDHHPAVVAARLGLVDVLTELHTLGVEINFNNDEPLYQAVAVNNPNTQAVVINQNNVLRTLFALGANKYARDCSIFESAIIDGKTAVVQAFIDDKYDFETHPVRPEVITQALANGHRDTTASLVTSMAGTNLSDYITIEQ
jgi:hypothetical protein